MITPDKAREAYQSAVPNRREAYKHAIQKVPRDSQFLLETMRVSKEELRLRLQMAADRVKQMVDSGWTPANVGEIKGVYLDMFARYDSASRNSFDDLYGVIDYALDNVGIADRAKYQRLYSLEFGQYQVDVSTEFTHDLEFYMATKQPNNQNVTNLNLQGNVNYLQTGGVANVTQNIGFNAAEAVKVLQALRDAVNSSDEPFKDAIVELVDKSIDESKKPGAGWPIVANTLNGIQNLVRTAGAVPGAYSLVSALFAAHGVHLPALTP